MHQRPHDIPSSVWTLDLPNVCVHIYVVIPFLHYSQVCEENRWIGTVRLDVLHGVPLVDTELVGGDPALVVADPGQEQAAWVVVMTASHLARFVERLEGWPEADSEREEDSHLRGCLEGKETKKYWSEIWTERFFLYCCTSND